MGEGVDGGSVETSQAIVRTSDFIIRQIRNPWMVMSKRVT